jgi:hypothetical protein
MRKGQHAAKPGKRRVKFVNVRYDLDDYERLKDRAQKGGAKTVSDYVRRAALTGPQINMPPWEHLRELRNELINYAAAVRTAPNSKTREKVLQASLAALERIVKF